MTSNTKENSSPKDYSNPEESENHGKHKPNTENQIGFEQVKEVDENLSTMQKIHAILLNCINLTKKQKLEFAESERFFMKLHLKKILKKLKTL
jgi:hypothetical protein